MSKFAQSILWLIQQARDHKTLSLHAKLVADSLAIGTISQDEYTELRTAGLAKRTQLNEHS
jgi:hypothetical protein